MRPADYLNAAKAALRIESDYALAKAMGIDGARLLKLKREMRPLDGAEILWIAITLKIDPATVLAELSEQRENNQKKKDFLRGFLTRAAAVTALCVTLASSFTGGAESAAAALGGRRRGYA